MRQAEDREVVDERRVREVLQRFVKVARTPNTDPWQSWLEALSDVRLGLRDPATVEAERGDVDGFEAVFDRFREELSRRGWVDFDEQVYRALELLLTDAGLRARVQLRCTHLLVDEFQDLTPAFLLLVRLVAAPRLQVFGVGDDDQTIYGHVGASPEYLVDYDRWFPGAADHPLEVNYRCPTGVVTAASTLLGHNGQRVDKTIRPGPQAVVAEPHVHVVATSAMTQRVVRLARGPPRRRVVAGRPRRAGPRQRVPAAAAGRARRGRHPAHRARRGAGAGAHRHAHRTRVPADRWRPGPHPTPRRRRDRAPALTQAVDRQPRAARQPVAVGPSTR